MAQEKTKSVSCYNIFSCFEVGSWDPHPHIQNPYQQLPEKNKVYQDMTLPLSNYFISSGHNSYLTGNQLNSASGTATIIMCLDKGCRVIELDVYNGDPGKPICKHGGTLTKAVLFETCVIAIRDHAFTASQYPAIITIENHTSPEEQKSMAAILRRVLGDKLFVPPKEKAREWLSPEALKGKVLIRTSLKHDAAQELRDIVYVVNSKFNSLEEKKESAVPTSSSFEESKVFKVDAFEGYDQEVEAPPPGTVLTGDTKEDCEEPSKPDGVEPVSPMLSKVRSRSIKQSQRINSMKESGKLFGIKEVYEYTSRHLMRVYPAGWRVGSGNYNPEHAWSVGASLAAMNWQNWDNSLKLNEGKFMDNGGCGYVLKPLWMRQPQDTLPLRAPSILGVTVFSAHRPQGTNASFWKDDLFVKMEILGMPMDKASQKTETIMNSGRLLVEKRFEFQLEFPEMAILKIKLMDEDTKFDDIIGYTCMPVATLNPGTYKLSLKKDSGKKMHADNWIKVRLDIAYGVTPGPSLPIMAKPEVAAAVTSSLPAAVTSSISKKTEGAVEGDATVKEAETAENGTKKGGTELDYQVSVPDPASGEPVDTTT